MKFLLCLMLISLPLAATPILGLYPTGVDSFGNALAGGATDGHYAVIGAGSAAVINGGLLPSVWLPNSTGSSWIWQTANGQPASSSGVQLTFRTTFDLTGRNPATAYLDGSWAADNEGVQILLNGAAVAITSPDYDAYQSFHIASGFTADINTLDFVVKDWGYMGGFRVASLTGDAALASSSSTPEPATLGLMFGGLGLLAGLARHRTFSRRS